MAIQTELTRALGIKIPLVQGGMQWVSVAATENTDPRQKISD